MDKKQVSQLKLRFALHVSLIMHQLGESKAAATFRAWCEGDEGLSKRLAGNPPE